MAKEYSVPGEEDLHRTITTHRLLIITVNFVALLTSLVTITICFWIRFDLDFWEWVQEIEWYSYWYAMYPSMFASIGVALLSIVSIKGAVDVNLGWTGCYMWTLVIMFFFHLICAVVIIVWGVEESTVLIGELSQTFLRLVYDWDEDPRSSRILKQIMEYVGCCGADGSDDFINAFKPVPYECRDRVLGTEYAYGCQQGLAWWLEPWSGFLGGVNVFFMVIDVFAFWIVRRFNFFVNTYRRNYGDY